MRGWSSCVVEGICEDSVERTELMKAWRESPIRRIVGLTNWYTHPSLTSTEHCWYDMRLSINVLYDHE